jgi:pimeloyl-ACP methyl ester carboxylesterase
MASFRHEGHRLSYTIYGDGPRTTVLLPGLLFSKRMHAPLARELAERGNRVVTFDLLGHGRSDRPRDMRQYSMRQFAEQTLALLDHLEVDQAVVGGTSLGANVTLTLADAAPERLRGMLVEMPVLDNALLGCAIAFTPLMISLTFGEPVMKLVARAARAVPSGAVPFWGDVMLDWLRQEPGPSAAVLQGLFFGQTAPHASRREKIGVHTLIIGHGRDPIHPFSDSDALVHELPDARLIEAESLVELRLWPERLTREICDFVDECWKPRRAATAAPGRTTAKRARS